MTDERPDLDALERLLVQATHQPWATNEIDDGEWQVLSSAEDFGPFVTTPVCQLDQPSEAGRSDGTLISAAVNALPALIRDSRALAAERAAREQAEGAIRAQDEREQKAGDSCGVPFEHYGCDWPDAVAEAFIFEQRVREQEHARMYALLVKAESGAVEEGERRAQAERERDEAVAHLAAERATERKVREELIAITSQLQAKLDAAAPYTCPTCGPHVRVDEDECCAACGADSVNTALQEPTP